MDTGILWDIGTTKMELLKSIIKDREGEIVGNCFKEHKYHKPVKIPVKCKNNHIWNPGIDNLIYSNSWCPTCYRRTYKIDDLHNHAENMGGKCLSTKYTNTTDKYTWKCGQCDCVWDATWASLIYMHSWCPNCSNSCREVIARLACEEYTGYLFVKRRDVLGYNAEIDLWSDDLDFGFEIDGIQHAEFVPYYHVTEDVFEAQKARDRKKDEVAKQNGVVFDRIPHTISINALRKFMHNFLAIVAGIDPPEHELISDNEFFALVAKTRTSKNLEYCKQIMEIVNNNNGRVKGTLSCITRKHKFVLICEHNHEFETNFDQLVRGCWCKYCATNAPLTYEIIKDFVESKGYKLISEYYATDINYIKKIEDPLYEIPKNTKPNKEIRNRKFIKVKCPDNDHEPYLIMWDNFKKGNGCKKCGQIKTSGNNRKTQSDLDAELSIYGLKLLSIHKNLNTDSLFQCNKNHQFTSTVTKIRWINKCKNSNRCPQCIVDTFKNIKLTNDIDPKIELSTQILQLNCNKCKKTFSKPFKAILAASFEKCGSGH
jgi:ribosomal protein S27E